MTPKCVPPTRPLSRTPGLYFQLLLMFPLRWLNGHLSLHTSKTEFLIFCPKLLYWMTTHPSSCSGVKVWSSPSCPSLTPTSNLSRHPICSTFKTYLNPAPSYISNAISLLESSSSLLDYWNSPLNWSPGFHICPYLQSLLSHSSWNDPF